MHPRERIRIAVTDGDERQRYLREALQRDGYTVFPVGAGTGWKAPTVDAVVLPLPATTDGLRIFTPDGGSAPRFSAFLDGIEGSPRVFGGRIPPEWVEYAEARGFFCEDLFASELLQLKNALPTAEGAIWIAMRETPTVLFDLPVSVVGFGRIGELLAEKLRALGATVTVCARREEVRVRAALRGFRVGEIPSEGCVPSPNTRIVFNTVPARVLGDRALRALPRGCLLIELASGAGGFDPDAAREAGLIPIRASALPGRYAPETAGKILAETVEDYLRRPPTTGDEEGRL